MIYTENKPSTVYAQGGKVKVIKMHVILFTSVH
jgi:hypothetical protein